MFNQCSILKKKNLRLVAPGTTKMASSQFSVFIDITKVILPQDGEPTEFPRKAQQFKNSAASLQWRNNERNGVSKHRRFDCLLNRLFRHRSKKISKLRVTGLREGNPTVTDGFPSQRASNEENVSSWWRHHHMLYFSPYFIHIHCCRMGKAMCKLLRKDEGLILNKKKLLFQYRVLIIKDKTVVRPSYLCNGNPYTAW